MKVKKVLFLWSIMALGSTYPLAAQTDVTNQYIVNPGFEDTEDASTTGVGTVKGWERTTTDGYGWSGCNGDWKTEGERSFGIWKPSIESDFEFWQDLTLPNGIYRLTVDMTVSKSNQTSRVNGQRLFAGDVEVYYPESAETPKDNGAPYQLELTTTVTDGTLKIGIRTNGGTASGIGWFKVDNFKLYAFLSEEDMVHYYQELLENAAEEITGYSETLPGGEATLLISEKDKIMESVEGSTVADDYKTAIESLNTLKKNAEPVYLKYQELILLLEDTYSELKELNYAGLEDLDEAWIKGLDVRDGETTLLTDVENAIEAFNAAAIAYKKSGFPSASIDAPVDANYYMQNADMSEGSSNWTLNGFTTQTTGDNIENFGGTFLEKWVQGPSSLSDYSAHQILTELPNGIYKISAAVVATQQSDATLPITGALLFANTGVTETSTGNGVGELFDVYGVVTNGTLKIGMKTVGTNANWVAFDNVTLAYCGKSDQEIYNTAYQNTIAEAEVLAEKELLPKDLEILVNAIKTAKNAPHGTIAEIETALAPLQTVLNETEILEKAVADFRKGSYAKALAICENAELIYRGEICEIMANVLLKQNEIFEKDTTSIAAFPALTAEIDIYLAFVDAFQNCENYANELNDEDLINILQEVLSNEIANVASNPEAIEPAKKTLKTTVSFCDTYLYAINYLLETEDGAVAAVVEAQRILVSENTSMAEQGERAILESIATQKFQGIEPGEDTDITWAITNPNFEDPTDESTTGVGTVNGWKRTTTDGYNWSGCNGDWKSEGERSFGIWAPTISSNFEFSQDIILPNGVYRLSVDMNVGRDGSGSRVNGQRLFGGDKEAYYPAEAETEDNGTPYTLTVTPEVTGYKLPIGIRTNGGSTRGIGWYKVDNFKLFWVGLPTGIETINDDSTSELVAYAENGYIIVPGVENYTITTIDGVSVLPNKQLTGGIYIVTSGTKSVKVSVK